jgi:hypothetical protein
MGGGRRGLMAGLRLGFPVLVVLVVVVGGSRRRHGTRRSAGDRPGIGIGGRGRRRLALRYARIKPWVDARVLPARIGGLLGAILGCTILRGTILGRPILRGTIEAREVVERVVVADQPGQLGQGIAPRRGGRRSGAGPLPTLRGTFITPVAEPAFVDHIASMCCRRP